MVNAAELTKIILEAYSTKRVFLFMTLYWINN